MADFHLIAMHQELYVEGDASSGSLGPFGGRVLAIAVRGIDPVAAPDPGESQQTQTEGLLGWGTTHMLVACPEHDAPIWVSKEDITGHRVGEAGERAASGG